MLEVPYTPVKEQKDLYCNSCTNHSLSTQKKLRQRLQRQQEINDQITYLNQIQIQVQLQQQEIQAQISKLRQESKQIGLKLKPHKERFQIPQTNFPINFHDPTCQIKKKYKRELLQQIYEKRVREQAQKEEKRIFQQWQFQRMELETRSAVNDIIMQRNLQREDLRDQLERQIQQKREFRLREKILEKERIDQEIALYQSFNESLRFSQQSWNQFSPAKLVTFLQLYHCGSCNRMLPFAQLSKFYF